MTATIRREASYSGEAEPIAAILVRMAPSSLGPLAGLVPGGLTVYLAFQTGGYFAGATAVATLVVLLFLLARVLLAEDPLAGVGIPLGVAAGALMLLAAWTLLSSAWSDSAARAMLEFDRVLLYLLVLVWFGSFARSSALMRWMLWGLAIGMTAVCAGAFITRTLPDFWSAPPQLQNQRLSYPIGYWNALGLIASLALVFCLHLTSSAREPRVVRILAASACPVLGATLYFTFSRGPIAVAGIGLLAYVILGRPRLLLTGLLASATATVAAVIVAYQADQLAEFVKGRGYRFSEEAVAQGHDVALGVAVCVLGAAAARALGMLVFDETLERLRLKRATKRRLAVVAGSLAVVGVAFAIVAGARGDWFDTQYDRLFRDPVAQTGDYRDRLFNPGLNRLDGWEVAWDGFADEPFTGHGARTYELLWDRSPHGVGAVSKDAHSLYLETMAELGVVGVALLLIVLLTILGCLAIRLRERRRALYAAIFATTLMWCVHAALDWDWEIPAVTLWVFAAGGAALASQAREGPQNRLGLAPRLVLAGILLVLAITPARVALSHAPLVESEKAYRAGDCKKAIDSARQSISALGNRSEPYEILAYCEARTRASDGGVSSMEAAVERDPRNWRLHYGLALVRAAAGDDPRSEARAAVRFNSSEPLAREALRRFDTSDPAAWRRAARTIGLDRPE